MSTTTDPQVITEPTAWLRGVAGAQVARARRLGLDPDDPAAPVIVAPLAGRLSVPGSINDRTCDRCQRYCRPGEDFHALTYGAAASMVLIGGLCAPCAALELAGVTP